MSVERSRVLRALVALAVAASVAQVSVAGAGAATQSASGVHVSIADVSVEPTQPEAGERATVTTTIRNAASSTEAVDVTSVAIRTGPDDRFEELRRIEDLGAVTPGNELDVPLTVTFDDPGYRVLRVHVWAENESGATVHVQYPLTVNVQRENQRTAPGLSLSAGSAVAGVDSTVNATVVNPLDEPMKDVEVSLSSEQVDVLDDRAIDAQVAAGTKREYAFDVVADSPGTYEVTATVRYRTPSEGVKTTERTLTMSVDPLDDRVDLLASSTNGGDAVTVELSNLGNARLRDGTVRVSAPSDSGWSNLELVNELAANAERTVTVDTAAVPNGTTLAVEFTYVLAGETRRAETSVTVPAAGSGWSSPRIDLTGIDVEREDGKIHVSGSASNLGGNSAKSVVVRVVATEHVEPAFPGREYFVGTVPASDFAAFDVYARLDANATEIPLAVSYVADGERRTRTVSVPYEGDEAGLQSTEPQRGDSSPLPFVVGGVVVIGVAGAIGVGWRNYRETQ